MNKEKINRLVMALDSFFLAFKEMAKESGFPLAKDSSVYEDYERIKKCIKSGQ
jgi:hypothetical protein